MARAGHRERKRRAPGLARRCMAAALLLACAHAPLGAATRTASFTVNANVVSDCTIVSAPNLDFGTIGVQNVAYYGTSILAIECTPGTAYTVSLDAGSVGTSTVANRLLNGPGGNMAFNLYRDAGYTQVWGMTPGSDTAGGTGTGSSQNFTVYGRITGMQTAKAPGAYTTTITATVTY